MSRPAAAVTRVIKAYDVRGLVGEEIDEAFVSEVGGAFARLMRDEGDQPGTSRRWSSDTTCGPARHRWQPPSPRV